MSQLAVLASVSQRVSATSSRIAKIKALGQCLRQLAEDEVAVAALYLSGELPQGKIGIGLAALRLAGQASPSEFSQLTIRAVDTGLNRYASIKGAGTAAVRAPMLDELFTQATAEEQAFLFKLLSGELRQVTMRRFGRKLNVETLRKELPLFAFFFDCLKLNGVSLAERPTHERIGALTSVVPQPMLMPRLLSDHLDAAQAFYAEALFKGHEGIRASAELDSLLPTQNGLRAYPHSAVSADAIHGNHPAAPYY